MSLSCIAWLGIVILKCVTPLDLTPSMIREVAQRLSYRIEFAQHVPGRSAILVHPGFANDALNVISITQGLIEGFEDHTGDTFLQRQKVLVKLRCEYFFCSTYSTGITICSGIPHSGSAIGRQHT